MKEVDGVPNSETQIEQINRNGLYRLTPATGKKHQLRVHMAALGVPILNDKLYPELRPPAEDDYSKPLKLVARSLSFRDPVTGQDHHFESRVEL
jgi:tRNA pseudouridine32 synthase/23S rRNA pseudouridine746 synthase